MTEQAGGRPSTHIDRMIPTGPRHALASQAVLDGVGVEMSRKQGMVGLAEYLQNPTGKPRSTEGGAKGLNSHFEEFIVRDSDGIRVTSLSDLQSQLTEAGSPVQILGVESIGNNNQRVSARVQGLSEGNEASGFERPTVAEGPHMILAPYAIDGEGNMHLFRTIQYRTGAAVIDTPRGFADATALASGEQMYNVDQSGDRVEANMKRVLGEEGGEKLLDIKRVVYLGAPRVNSSFVTSKSALFGVEVDYDNFIRSNKVVTQTEMQRRQEAANHEGLTGAILDMTVDEYANYKRDSEIDRDMAADSPSDTVVIDWLSHRLDTAQAVMATRQDANRRMGRILQGLKGHVDEETYKEIVRNVIQAEAGQQAEQPQIK